MKMTKNLTHIASSVEFEPAMTEEQLEAVFAQNDVAGFPAELDIAERTEAVSYTHLDVYKRQASRTMPVRRPSASLS